MTMKASLTLMLLFPLSVLAWDGYDYEKGTSVEIDSGNYVRPGADIEVYDYDKGEYIEVEVQSIQRYGSSVEVEVYDYETGEYRTFEMDE